MHKDKPPGLFDFGDRSVAHAVGMGLGTGALLSIIVHVSLTVWRADARTPSTTIRVDATSGAVSPQRNTAPATAPAAVKF